MPKFLPWLPKPQQARLEAIVEREIASGCVEPSVLTRRSNQRVERPDGVEPNT